MLKKKKKNLTVRGKDEEGGRHEGREKRKDFLNTSKLGRRYSWSDETDETVVCPASFNLHPLSQSN